MYGFSRPLAFRQRTSVSKRCPPGCAPESGALRCSTVIPHETVTVESSKDLYRFWHLLISPERRFWLRFPDMSKTILLFASYESKKTISRFRALSRKSLFVSSDEAAVFASDAPLASPREPTHGIRKRERDRAERVRLQGDPKPSLRERAVALARERGEVRTKDLASIGIPRCYLSPMYDEGLLVKVGYGRYRAAPQKRRFKGRADRSG